MTDTFTASNGHIRVDYERWPGERIDLYAAAGGENMLAEAPWLGSDEVSALREFFQRERDEELGLWRSPSDPTWTAVRRNTTIYFHNEDHERSFHFVPRLETSIRAWSGDLQALAYEYIDAHPERKPWEDAEPGEVWELQYEQLGEPRQTRAFTVDSLGHLRNTSGVRMASLHITAGRRIWPEDAS